MMLTLCTLFTIGLLPCIVKIPLSGLSVLGLCGFFKVTLILIFFIIRLDVTIILIPFLSLLTFGASVTDQRGIKKVFCDFYNKLWSDPSDKSILDIFQALPTDLPLLLSGDGEALTKEVTKLELF